MRRTNLTGSDGTWAALLLDVRERPRPGLRVLTAENRLTLVQGTAPLLLGIVDPGRAGVQFLRTTRYRPLVPPLRAHTARAHAGSVQRWAHRFAEVLSTTPDGPLHDGR
ncbi:hypothetical protein ACH4U6_15170 [Streptomyces netropsis]|uniref:hypothetical protein n=1 Tax=Streptomyces netropsis TaxID=55404 RepID=UPI0037B8E6D4